MNRKDLANTARQALYANAPALTSYVAGEIINSAPFQKWMDSIERRRPRGIVAWFRRMRGERRGLTPEQQRELAELVRRELDKR